MPTEKRQTFEDLSRRMELRPRLSEALDTLHEAICGLAINDRVDVGWAVTRMLLEEKADPVPETTEFILGIAMKRPKFVCGFGRDKPTEEPR